MNPLLVPMHGVGGRQDLPLPFGVVLAAAAVALVVSFLVLAGGWRRPRCTSGDDQTRLVRLTRFVDSRAVRAGGQLLGLTVSGWALLALLVGGDTATNPIFGFVYVWVWVGLVPLTLLLGPFWPRVSPLRTLHAAACRFVGSDPDRGVSDLPAGVGVWPAVVGLLGFVWLELIAPDRASVPVLTLAVAAYVAFLVCGAVFYGSAWFAAADPFEVYSTTLARMSVWDRSADGYVVIRTPLTNLAALVPRPGLVGFVVVLLGSTAYDGFSNTLLWRSWVQQQQVPGVLVATAALLGIIAAVALAFVGATRLAGRWSRVPLAGEPALFLHSLVPIALGYVTAHYLTLFWFEGQRTAILFSDPLSRGWNVFGTAELAVDYGLATWPALIAVVQAGAVVVGHVVGIVTAHDRALELAPRRQAAVGQVPMLVVMVGYTLTGLGLLFAQ